MRDPIGEENRENIRLICNDLRIRSGFALYLLWSPDAATDRAIWKLLRESITDDLKVVDAERWPPDRGFAQYLNEQQPASPNAVCLVRFKEEDVLHRNALAFLNNNRNAWLHRTQHAWIFVLPSRARLSRRSVADGGEEWFVGNHFSDTYSIRTLELEFDPISPEFAPPEARPVGLPPLTEVIDTGAAGGLEFERLMSALLIELGRRASPGFSVTPIRGAGGDGGMDSLIESGELDGMRGRIAFRFKWLPDLSESAARRQVQEWWRSARRADPDRRPDHWVLVTPAELTPGQLEWLQGLRGKNDPKLHHRGQTWIEGLLREVPSLLARYFPFEAKQFGGLPGYDGHPFGDFGRRYRLRIGLAHERVRTLGIPPEVTGRRTTIPLREIFVPVRLEPWSGGEAVPLAKALEGSHLRVILGDPGAGKTTLLAFLALSYATGGEMDGYQFPSDRVPLYIALRDFLRARAEAANPHLSFVDYLVGRARSSMGLEYAHPAYFEQLLRMGEAVVLIDGVDEANSESGRCELADAIRQFHHSYPNCPLWVTCRIHGYTGNVRFTGTDVDPVAEYRVAPLNEAEVDLFIRHWHRLHYPEDAEAQQERAESLRAALDRTPSVRRLRGNPLLLTLMAFLHYGSHQLPQDRGELLEKCIEMLLRTWNDARRREQDPHPFDLLAEKTSFDWSRQQEYLEVLALGAQSRGGDEDSRAVFTREEALEWLAAHHLAESEMERPSLTPRRARSEMGDFLDYIADRTGILLDRGDGRYQFIHLSFQEYLAARRLHEEGFDDDARQQWFIDRLGHTAWEEVLLLRLYLMQRGSSRDRKALHQVVQTMYDGLRSDSSNLERTEQSWLTLSRAVRDNLQLGAELRYEILTETLSRWLRKPEFSGEWFGVLEEIHLFAPLAREALSEGCRHVWRDPESSPAHAIAVLHLKSRLGGLPPDTDLELEKRGDLRPLFPALLVFHDTRALAHVVERLGTPDDWRQLFDLLEPREVVVLIQSFSDEASNLPEAGLRGASLWLDERILRERDRQGRLACQLPPLKQELKNTPAMSYRAHAGLRLDLSLPSTLWATGSDHANSLTPTPMLTMPTTLSGRLDARSAERILAPEQNPIWFRWCALEEMAQSTLERWHEWCPNPADENAEWLRRVSDFFRDFVRDFSREFGRDFSRYFVRDFFRSFVRDFDRYFGRGFGRYFGRYFDGEFGRDFGREFGRDFVRYFVRSLGQGFVWHLGASFAEEWVKTVDIDPVVAAPATLEVHLARSETASGIARLLADGRFWDRFPQVSRIQTSQGVGLASGASYVVPMGSLLPMGAVTRVLFQLQLVAIAHRVARDLWLDYPKDAFPEDAVSTAWKRYPPELYSSAFAWPTVAREIGFRLAGPRGAMILLFAAHVEQITGIDLSGPDWDAQLEARDAADPEIEEAYEIYRQVRVKQDPAPPDGGA